MACVHVSVQDVLGLLCVGGRRPRCVVGKTVSVPRNKPLGSSDVLTAVGR